MKNQALFSLKGKSKKLKCPLFQCVLWNKYVCKAYKILFAIFAFNEKR